MAELTLISHHLCPYVQRAVIALTEKGVAFDRVYVDLANKPGWFLELSPLGKTPVLKVDAAAVFESAVILEYLEETGPRPLHPAGPLRRARHRAWMEFGSAILDDIAGLYSARDEVAFTDKAGRLAGKFDRIERELGTGPWFDGNRFSLVDAVFGPVFRYFDVFDRIGDFGILAAKPEIAAWREALSGRPSVARAVPDDYETRLTDFLIARNSHMSRLIEESAKVGGPSARRMA
jgi:glutathione S-transferase